MRRYRESKKEKLTDNIETAKRQKAGKEIQMKKEENERQIKEKRQTEKLKKEKVVLRTQMWRMKIKLNCSTTGDNKQSENQTNMNNADDVDSLISEVQIEDMGSTEENKNNTEIEKEDTGFKSAWSKYRAVTKVKECLPKTPGKKTLIISQLDTSPSCRGIVEEEGSVVTLQVRKKIQTEEHLLSSLHELSKEAKEPVNNSLDNKGAVHTRRNLRRLVNAVGTNKKSKGVQRDIENYSG
ncbi:unnamed protein product [Mytilus coruscus]|uniref:Uncharacterized protein n=1 Tax=Mytilus coruscus TaxID=42192 RepID=A0A6J8BVY5_MYTCO|nr:unnamed protein product [Mytilus coruscus]